MDTERTRSDVVGNATQTSTIFGIVFVVDSKQIRCCEHDRLENVDVVVRLHTCIQAATRSSPIPVSMFLLGNGVKLSGGLPSTIELRKHQVPDLQLAAVAAMVVDLAARSAHSIGTLAGRTCWPEVLVFVQPLNARLGQANVCLPNLGCFVVVLVDRHRQLVRIDPNHFLSVSSSQAQLMASRLK